MVLGAIKRSLSHRQKEYLKTKWVIYVKRRYLKVKIKAVNLLYSYSPEQLENKLRTMGVIEGDTVLMHSSFNSGNGFKGEAKQVIECVLNVIGPSGNLSMMSMSYTGFAYKYFREEKCFAVKTTISRMGIITEIFRRRKGVLRSLNPAHPVLAYGPKAEWITSDHEKTIYSCGKRSPFQKLLELNAKVLFFDVDYLTCTFLHYLENNFRNDIPLKVYHDELMESIVIGSDGEEIGFRTYVFNPDTARSRDRIWLKLKDELIKKKILKRDKIGNSELMLVTAKQLADGGEEIVKKRLSQLKATSSSPT